METKNTTNGSTAEMAEKILARMKEQSFEVLHALDESTVNACAINRDLIRRIISDNQDTEYGRKYGFSSISSIDEYRNRVPLTSYSDYEPYIDRMTEGGEENLLTAYPVVYYASTSGTSGMPKKIPVTDRGLDMFRKYASFVMLSVISETYYTTKYEDSSLGLRMTLISFSRTPLANGVDFGSISAACMTDKSIEYLPYIMSTPREVMFCRESADLKYLHARYGLAQRDIVYITGAYIPALLDMSNYIIENWEMLVADIRYGRIDESIRMPEALRNTLEASLKPDPERADALEAEFNKGLGDNILRRIWPKLSAVCAIWAGNFHAYARKMQNSMHQNSTCIP